jgi:cell wall-associated NlpC family hydrolase
MAVTTPVPLSDLQPGDLLFYYDSPGYIGHVTMYVGPGEMIQAEDDHADLVLEPCGSWSALTDRSARRSGRPCQNGRFVLTLRLRTPLRSLRLP